MVEQLNAIARLWWEWSVGMFWQVGLLILLIAALDRLIRRWAWPQLRYALWSLILVKLLLPPSLSLPSGIVPELQPVVQRVLAHLDSQEARPVQNRTLRSLNEDMLGACSAPVEASGVSSVKPEVSGNEPALHTSNFTLQTPEETTDQQPFVRVAWQVYAMTASLLGTLILGIWLFFRLRSLVGRNAQVAAAASLPQSFYNQLAGCARRLELHRIPRVVVTKKLATPAVFGVFRPVLLMPRDYLGRLSQQGTEHMLLHELAHIKRGDLIAHGLYMLLQIVYWYNPLLWLVRRQVHHLRELSCDATVAELLREQTAAYRQTLLETARRLLTSSVEPGLGLLGLFEDSNRLLVRLDWLAKPTWRHKTMKRIAVTIVAALMLACVLPMARAEEAASNREERVVTAEEIQVSQQMNQLQAQLDQLKAQQEELQGHLRALAEQRARITGQRLPTQASAEPGGMARSSVPQGNTTGQQWDLRAEQFRNWAQSEQVQQWTKDMALWQKQMEEWAQTQRSGQTVDGTNPGKPFPSKPKMPMLPQVSRGLVGHWNLDETEGTVAMDSSDYHHDGVILGSPVRLPEGGRVGGALQFDGVKDGVDTGWAEDLPVWTVAVWVKSPVSPRPGAPNGPVSRAANFQINWNHHTEAFRGAAGLRVGQDWYNAGFGPLRADTWYHLAATYDGETLRAYRDGLLVTENTLPSGRPAPESHTLQFGRNPGDPRYFFAGTIDEVYVFAEVLGPEEIRELYSR